MVIQKDVFWKAGILTLLVFSSGVVLGYILESNRIDEIRAEYRTIEKQWADAEIQSSYYDLFNTTFCNEAIEENLAFADRVYKEGLKIERYEENNKLTEDLLYDKERYILLKLKFWLNSVHLKERCKTNYVNLLYFYAQEPSLVQKGEQGSQAIILKNLKEKYGSELMLIPLPIDLNIATINILKEAYNIDYVPTILINEKIKLDGVQSIEEIEKVMKDGL